MSEFKCGSNTKREAEFGKIRGIGFYIFVPEEEAERTLKIGKAAGYELFDLGVVEEGERCVIFEPEGITLPPPGE